MVGAYLLLLSELRFCSSMWLWFAVKCSRIQVNIILGTNSVLNTLILNNVLPFNN